MLSHTLLIPPPMFPTHCQFTRLVEELYSAEVMRSQGWHSFGVRSKPGRAPVAVTVLVAPPDCHLWLIDARTSQDRGFPRPAHTFFV
jgi:hypothetical protein